MTFDKYRKCVWDRLSNEQKQWITIWFNSGFDAYGINGTGYYSPLDVDEMAEYAWYNDWEFNENGKRINY